MTQLLQKSLRISGGKHPLLWGAALLGVMWVTPAWGQGMPCVSTADLATIIRDGPARLAMEGIGFDGRLFQMTVNPADGAWLLWVTAPGAKLSCIGVGGEDLKLGVPPKASADDPA